MTLLFHHIFFFSMKTFWKKSSAWFYTVSNYPNENILQKYAHYFFKHVWVVVSIFHLDQNKQHGVLQNRPLTMCVQSDAFWVWPLTSLTLFTMFQNVILELLFRTFKLPICFYFFTNNIMKEIRKLTFMTNLAEHLSTFV